MANVVATAPSPVVVELEPGTHSWCSCGKSKNQPLCDGSYMGPGCDPQDFTVTEKKKYALCRCGRTSKAPFCDATHKRPAGT